MGHLVYSAITSLDGYTADRDGRFDWSAPDEEVHGFVNDQERSIGTYLLGRRMYETMRVWQTMGGPDEPAVINDYADLWRAADKIVFSRTLTGVDTPRTTLLRDIEPDRIRSLSADHDVSVGGPGLAEAALRAGLVDEVSLYLNPVIIGGGTRALPDDVRLDLALLEQHRFGNGVVFLRYQVSRDQSS